jgi:uncharacterized protein
MPNPVIYFEIGCRDTAQASHFYSSLFGWQSQAMGPALMIQTGSQEGIQGHYVAHDHEPSHYTIFYVQVESIEESIAKAVSLGGKNVVPKIDIPTGSFAWISDPQGNIVGLWKPAAAA